jgi:hypothetical protein
MNPRRARASRGSRPATPHSRDDRGIVVGDPAASVQEHDPLVLDELGHVLVRRADEDLLDRRIRGEAPAGRSDRVVGLELDHRPDDEPERPDRVLDDRELGQQLGRHTRRRLVAQPEVVPERLDDVVGRAADVGRALLAQQEEQLLHDSRYA